MSVPYRSVVAALTLSLLGFGLSGCGEGEDQQLKYLERAEKFFAEENYDKARIDAKNVLQINPKNLDARVILADIDFQDGNLRKAFGGYTAVSEEDATLIGAQIGLSKIHVAVKGFEKALEHADDALAIDANNTEAMGFKALALIGLERSDEAFELAKQALAVEPGNAAALGVTTQHLSLQGNYEAALELLNAGQQSDPDEARIALMKLSVLQEIKDGAGVEKELIGLTESFPESERYSTMLAGFYIRDGQPAKAEAAMRRYAEVNADSYEAKQSLIVYLLQHESEEKAIAQAKAYIEADPEDTRLVNALAEIYLFTGDTEQGMQTLYQSIDSDPESVGAIEARTRLVQLYLNDRELDKATGLIEDILELEPENETALLGRAGIRLSNRDVKAAIADLRTVTKNNPENREALKVLSQAQEAAGNRDLALDGYKKLLGLGDRSEDTLANAARLAIRSGQYDEAEKYIRASLEIQEQADNPGLITNLVRLLALKEDWTEASEFAQRLIASENSNALGYYLQGAIDLQTDEKASALGNFKRSLEIQPEAIESLSAYATQLAEQQGLDKAIAYVSDHCKAHSFGNCHYVLGTLHAQESDFGSAKRELEKSLSLDDQSLRTYRQLARVYAAEQDFAGYQSLLERAIDATDNRSIKFDLATFHYARRNYQAAVDIYEAIIENSQGKALAAKNNLAMIYADNLPSEANMKRAVALIADLQESDNAAYLDTVGWVSYRNGDYDQAVTYTKAAVDKLGDAPLLHYHLGAAYYKTGNMEKAAEHLTLATNDAEARYDGRDEAVSLLASIEQG